MEKLVFDRLIAEIEKPGKAAERQLDNLRDTHFAVVQERDRLRGEVRAARDAELSFRNLLIAAKAVATAKTPARRRAAISNLMDSIRAAENHIEYIPF